MTINRAVLGCGACRYSKSHVTWLVAYVCRQECDLSAGMKCWLLNQGPDSLFFDPNRRAAKKSGAFQAAQAFAILTYITVTAAFCCQLLYSCGRDERERQGPTLLLASGTIAQSHRITCLRVGLFGVLTIFSFLLSFPLHTFDWFGSGPSAWGLFSCCAFAIVLGTFGMLHSWHVADFCLAVEV